MQHHGGKSMIISNDTYEYYKNNFHSNIIKKIVLKQN